MSDCIFEIIDNQKIIKESNAKTDIAKNILNDLIFKEINNKNLPCDTLIGLRLARGENYPEDFLKPEVAIVDYEKCGVASNGMAITSPRLVVDFLVNENINFLLKKKEIYREMGTLEYWIIDVENSSILKQDFTNNKEALYDLSNTTIEINSCGIELSINEFFDELNRDLARIFRLK